MAECDLTSRLTRPNPHTSLVTGATGTVGRAIAMQLAARGGAVVLAARDGARLQRVRDDIVGATGNARVYVEPVDVAIRSDVKAFVKRFMATHPKLHVMVNAHGIFARERSETIEGIERVWATNVLGTYQVTARLLPMLRYCRPARLINVVSSQAWGLHLSDSQFSRRSWHPWEAWAASQQALHVLTWALAEGLDPSVVAVNAVDPGPVTDSPLFHGAPGWRGLAAAARSRLAGRMAAEAVETAVWLATSRQVEGEHAQLWRRRRSRGAPFHSAEHMSAIISLCESRTRVPVEFETNIWREDYDTSIVRAVQLSV